MKFTRNTDSPWRFTLVAALSFSALIALSGCAAESDGSTAPTESRTTPTDGTDGSNGSGDSGDSNGDGTDGEGGTGSEPALITLPTCETMNATIEGESDAFYTLQGDAGVTAHRGEVGLNILNDTVGPIAQATMAEAVQVQGCTWPVHYHNVVTQYVAELPDADRDALIEALRASDYVESTEGDATRFDYTIYGEPGLITINTDITYLFIGEVWIAIMGNGQLEYAPAALAAVFDLNPRLAPPAA